MNELQNAIRKAQELEYENGMATEKISVERENCYVHVIRKCGSLNHPEVMLFRIIPKNNLEPDYDSIERDILDGMGIYGDLKIDFHGEIIDTVVIGNEKQ